MGEDPCFSYTAWSDKNLGTRLLLPLSQSCVVDYLYIYHHLEPLTFIEPPDSEVVVWEGSPVTLTCTATGNPTPDTVQWFRGNVLVNASGSYTIDMAMRGDSGIYQCEAQAGQSRSVAQTYLNVHCKYLFWLYMSTQVTSLPGWGGGGGIPRLRQVI